MKRITRIIRHIICMAVLLFAMTTAVMGCYQKETEPIDIPGITPSGTSAPQPSATPAGEVIPSVDRQAELAEARAKNPDTVAVYPRCGGGRSRDAGGGQRLVVNYAPCELAV